MENVSYQIPLGAAEGTPSSDITHWLFPTWYQEAFLGDGPPVFSGSVECANISVNRDAIVKCLEEQGLMLRSDARHGRRRSSQGMSFLNKDRTVLVMFWPHSDHVAVYARNEENVSKVLDCLKQFEPEDPVKTLKAIVVKHSSFDLQDLYLQGLPLIRENYTPEVVEGYDKLVKGLTAERPKGRLGVLSGPPGTGKTFLIRALLHDLPKECELALITPSQLVGLTSVDSLMAFISMQRDHECRLIIMLEDADTLLVPRQADNMSSIQALLNLSDGLLGEALDIRIIATSNATKLEMDKALMRPGRLCCHIEVPNLKAEQCNQVYKRLTGREGTYKSSYSLATVYQDSDPL